MKKKIDREQIMATKKMGNQDIKRRPSRIENYQTKLFYERMPQGKPAAK